MGRKSLILVAAEKENENISVAVGGNAYIAAKGTILKHHFCKK